MVHRKIILHWTSLPRVSLAPEGDRRGASEQPLRRQCFLEGAAGRAGRESGPEEVRADGARRTHMTLGSGRERHNGARLGHGRRAYQGCQSVVLLAQWSPRSWHDRPPVGHGAPRGLHVSRPQEPVADCSATGYKCTSGVDQCRHRHRHAGPVWLWRPHPERSEGHRPTDHDDHGPTDHDDHGPTTRTRR